MKIYLVGGAVRDSLLELVVKDKDWVVVGSSVNFLLKKKFKQVGKDFPVFLHPKTHEEYALARTEYKSGTGYLGFKTQFSSSVTLIEDLKRRDLTINAIAKDKLGNYIDPFFGKKDLIMRILRHISPAFKDDPLRILRVARFMSSLSDFGFIIAKETLLIMQSIAFRNELSQLKGERIWKETEKALKTNNPQIYFKVLDMCDALLILFPEIYQVFLLNKINHVQNNFIHYKTKILKNLSYISKKTECLEIRFLFFFCCFDFLPIFDVNCNVQFFKNRNCSILLKKICIRLKIPNYIRDFCLIIIKNYRFLIFIKSQTSKDIVLFFNKINAWRNPKIIQKIVFLMNLGFLNEFFYRFNIKYSYKSIGIFLISLFLSAKNVSVKSIILSGFTGIEIRNELFRLRVIAIDNKRNSIS